MSRELWLCLLRIYYIYYMLWYIDSIIILIIMMYIYIYIHTSRGKELKSSTWLLFSHVQQAAVRHMSAGGAVGQTRSAHETKGTWTEERKEGRKDSESPYFLGDSSNFWCGQIWGVIRICQFWIFSSKQWSWAWCMLSQSWRIWWHTSMLRSLHQAFWRCNFQSWNLKHSE